MGEFEGRAQEYVTRWRPVERIARRLTSRYPHRKRILLPLTGLAFTCLAVLGGIEQVLRDLHPVGGERWSTPALASGPFSGPDVDHVRTVLDTWDRLSGSSESVLTTYAVVDTVFALVYALLLGMLLVMLKNKLGRGEPSPEREDEPASGQRPPELEDLRPYRRSVDIALLALGALVLVDIVENVAIGIVPHVGTDGSVLWPFAVALWVTFWLKTVAAIFVIVPSLVAVVTFLFKRPDISRPVFQALAVARGQLLVLAVLLAGLSVSDQAVDALRRWYEDGWDAVWAILMLTWLAVFVLVSTSGLLATAKRRRVGSEPMLTLVGLGLLVGGVAVISGLLFGAWIGLATLAGLLVVLGVLSWMVEGVPSDGAGRDVSAAGWLPLTLSLLVVLLPVLALVNAVVAPLVLGDLAVLWLLVSMAALLAVGGVILWMHEDLCLAWESRRQRRGFIWLTVALLAFVVFRIIHNPWSTSEGFGAIAFLGAFLLMLALILYLLIRRAEAVRPPDIVSVVRFRCTPVILLALVWIGVTSMVDRETSYHDVRTVDATAKAAAVHEGISPQTAFRMWREREEPTGRTRPVLFVAAAGGGIRAAYWTATVLSCILEGQGPEGVCDDAAGTRLNDRGVESLFAASGISGGSLGLASYAAHLSADPAPGWQETRLRDDYAAAIVAWGLFVDLPSALVRRTGGSDRAEILERGFERSWLDHLPERSRWRVVWGGAASTADSRFSDGLFDSWQTRKLRLPILMLNGTKVQEGCRLNVSVLDTSVEPNRESGEESVEDCLSLRLFDPTDEEGEDTAGDRPKWSLGTSDDLLTYLCLPPRAEGRGDVRLSTAVMLSARFPYALPSGRLTRCGDATASPANVVDGGYFDTSGASPLVELWGALAPEVSRANREHESPEAVAEGRQAACIVPYFLQIDTGYSDPVKRGDLSPAELLVPPVTALRARDAREHNARQAAALLFTGLPETGPPRSNRYAHVYPRAHAGVRAPLGWTLSEAARDELEKQLLPNKDEIARIRGWLADERPCPTS